jgi:hypothetical protein
VIFAGPLAQQRARAYFDALKSGALRSSGRAAVTVADPCQTRNPAPPLLFLAV